MDLNTFLRELANSVGSLRNDFENFQRAGRPLSRGGNMTKTVREALTADRDLTTEDFLCVFNTTGGNLNANLPPTSDVYDADTLGGIVYVIKKSVAANQLDINADGAETIEGSGTVSLLAQWDFVIVQAGNGAWYRLD